MTGMRSNVSKKALKQVQKIKTDIHLMLTRKRHEMTGKVDLNQPKTQYYFLQNQRTPNHPILCLKIHQKFINKSS